MKMKIKLFAVSIMAVISLNSFAQTKDDAVNAYNKAVSLASTDLEQAVDAMKESAEIASKVGADTIGQMAQQQIPTLQYNYATSLYRDKKVEEAIDNFKLAYDYSVQYNDAGTKAKTADLLPKLYLAKGVNDYKAGKFDAAVESYDQALQYDSTLARAWLNMGVAYSKQNKETEMRTAYDKAITTGLSTNDEKTVEAARKAISDDLLINANKAFKKNDFSTTNALLDQAIQYTDSNTEVFYLNAVALNKLSKFDEAITMAERGLAVEEDNATKKARFFFELGNAQAGKGDTANACASYKKAAVGPFAESANYQIKTVLKCN